MEARLGYPLNTYLPVRAGAGILEAESYLQP